MVLRHLSGRESDARYQCCIFCDANVRNATVHCLSFCAKWSVQRSAIVLAGGWGDLSGDTLALKVLGCDPRARVFKLVSRLASEIDAEAKSFWMR